MFCSSNVGVLEVYLRCDDELVQVEVLSDATAQELYDEAHETLNIPTQLFTLGFGEHTLPKDQTLLSDTKICARMTLYVIRKPTMFTWYNQCTEEQQLLIQEDLCSIGVEPRDLQWLPYMNASKLFDGYEIYLENYNEAKKAYGDLLKQFPQHQDDLEKFFEGADYRDFGALSTMMYHLRCYLEYANLADVDAPTRMTKEDFTKALVYGSVDNWMCITEELYENPNPMIRGDWTPYSVGPFGLYCMEKVDEDPTFWKAVKGACLDEYDSYFLIKEEEDKRR